MGLEAAGAGLKTVIANTIQTNDAGYARVIYSPDELPNRIQAFPTILILLGGSEPVTFSTQVDVVFRVVVIMGRQDTPASANKLIDYIEQTGDYSIYAAVASDRTLDGGADSAEVINNSGLVTFRWGVEEYLATIFEVRAYV